MPDDIRQVTFSWVNLQPVIKKKKYLATKIEN